MRRAPIVLTATVLGTAGVLLFKPVAASSAAVDQADGSTPTADSGSSTSAGSGGSSSDSSAAPSPAASASASSGSGSSSSGADDGTFTGDASTTRFGTTQVKVTIAGGRITAVDVVQENDGDPRSYRISEDAFPTLREEVLSKQTAAVDMVSGATYTSAQYEASLQSALDAAGFAAADGSKASTDVSTLQEQGGPGGGFGH